MQPVVSPSHSPSVIVKLYIKRSCLFSRGSSMAAMGRICVSFFYVVQQACSQRESPRRWVLGPLFIVANSGYLYL